MTLPRGACDTHVHVFDPAHFSFAARRAYTPGPATVASLVAMQHRLGLERVVLVQPSVYGSDNRCMLAAIATLEQQRARGIAVVDARAASREELEALHAGGVRGLRANLEVRGERDLAAAQAEIVAAAGLVRQMPGWCLQVHAAAQLLVGVSQTLRDLGVPVVLDHHAGIRDATDDAAVRVIADLLRDADIYVKLSAPWKLRDDSAALALAREFCAIAPNRVLWGSDWPHTGGGSGARSDPQAIEPFRAVDDAKVLSELRTAVRDDAMWERLHRTNAARLFGFA